MVNTIEMSYWPVCFLNWITFLGWLHLSPRWGRVSYCKSSTRIFEWELSSVCQTRSMASKFSRFKCFGLCYIGRFWKNLWKNKVHDVESRKQAIIKEWRDYSQEIINNAIDSFRKRLRQIIKADDRYIEHYKR